MMEQVIQKKIRCKALDAHPTEDAIIISYTVDAASLHMEERRDCKKLIRIKGLQETDNLSALSLEIVTRSGNLLSLSHADDLMSILSYLKRRQSNNSDTGKSRIDQLSHRPKTAASDRLDQYLRHKNESDQKQQERLQDPDHIFTMILTADFWKDHRIMQPQTSSGSQVPSLNDLSTFVDMLYEDYDRKMQAAIAIYRLVLVRENLSIIAENETLQLVLVRVMREEGRKCLDLATIVTTIFAIMSHYETFHADIAKYKFGSQCLDLVQHEIRKEEAAFQELSQHYHVTRESPAGSGSSHKTQVPAFPPAGASAPAPGSPEYEVSFKKYQSMVRKQNHFLKSAFCLLLSLSEDERAERKMLNRGIIPMLVKSLEREASSDFFTIIVMFLAKLSIHVENKNQLLDLNIIEKLYVILSSTISSSSISLNITLIHWTLSLLYNLSFDLKLRSNMIQIGVLPKLLYLWSKDRLHGHVRTEKLMFQILYQMSRGGKVRGLFNFSFGLGQESLDMMMGKVMKALDQHVSGHVRNANVKEMMALMINLSLCPKNSVRICSNGAHVSKLLEIAFCHKESAQQADILSVLVVKMLRNLTTTLPADDAKGTKNAFSCITDHAERICELIFETSLLKKSLDEKIDDGRICVEQDDLIETYVTESLGLLSNLVNSGDPALSIDWRSLFETYQIWSWSAKRLDMGSNCCEDDLILDVILLIGTAVSCQESAAHYLCSSDPSFMETLISLMNSKQDDDEIMLQIVFIITCLLMHASTKETVIRDERITDYLIDLMQDKNPQIRAQCCYALHVISDESPELGGKIKSLKFKSHNSKWISMMMGRKDGLNAGMMDDSSGDEMHEEEEEDGRDHDDEDDLEEDDDFHLFLKPDLLDSLDSVTDSNLSTPVAWDMSDMFTQDQADGSRSRASTSRPHTGYKRRTRISS